MHAPTKETIETAETVETVSLPIAWRRNCALLLSEAICFLVGFAFIDPMTIMPTFLKEFISSDSLIGMIVAFRAIALSIPQILLPRLLAHRPYAKPYLLLFGGIGRFGFLIFAVWLWFWGESFPHLVLPFFLMAVGLFMLMDGACWVPWVAMVERSLPPNIRAWYFGMLVTLSSLGALPAGWVVSRILPKWQFPDNYALLFLLCSAGIVLSWFCIAGILEQPREGTYEQSLSLKEYAQEVRQLLREDRHFRHFLLTFGLLNAFTLSSNFYVLDATDLWGKTTTDKWVGWYLAAIQVGGIMAGIAWNLSRRYLDTRTMLKILACIVTLIATSAILCRMIAPVAYLVPFFLQGMVAFSLWTVFATYLMEIYPADARQVMRMGIVNMLFTMELGLSLVGGWLVLFFPYPVLFAITSLITLYGARRLGKWMGDKQKVESRIEESI